jgi:Uma2 family endonuclease
MNDTLPRPRLAATHAADRHARIRWTTADLDRMVEVGLLGPDDSVELIGGEIVPMNSKSIRHEHVRARINRHLSRHLPVDLDVIAELGWRPNDVTYLEPDLLVYPAAAVAPLTPAPDVLLLIEVARTSRVYDENGKADLYAALGVRENWVIDADSLEAKVFTGPAPSGYGTMTTAPPTAALSPTLVPGLTLSLATLNI